MRLAFGGAEHLGAGPQVGAPDALEFLVELPVIELAHLLPVAVEAPRPVVERERVVAPEVLDIHDLEAVALAPVYRFGETGDPAAGEDVLADPELGVAHAHMADEVEHAQTAGLEIVGVGPDHLAELVAPRVLQRAD